MLTPNNEPLPSQQAPLPPDERKLWFDYLSKLNDRSLHETSKSGATTWVLLGVLVAIAYKAVPLIAWFLSVPGYLDATRRLFFLETNVAICLFSVLVMVTTYTAGSSPRRLLTERVRRSIQMTINTLWIVWGLLSVAQFWNGISFSGSWFVRWNLIGFGAYWLIVMLLIIGGSIIKHQQAKRKKTVLPSFIAFMSLDRPPRQQLLHIAVHAPLLLISVCGFFAYLRLLNGQAVSSWVVPLGASARLLVCVVIAGTLFVRMLRTAQKDAYLALERAIVVENLTPNEIRTRFVTQFLGTEIGEWLKEIGASVTAANLKLKQAAALYPEKVAEIAAINEQYALERVGRAKILLDEITATSDEHQATFDKCFFQVREYQTTAAVTQDEREILDAVIEQFRMSLVDTKSHSTAVKEALNNLKKLVAKDSQASNGASHIA